MTNPVPPVTRSRIVLSFQRSDHRSSGRVFPSAFLRNDDIGKSAANLIRDATYCGGDIVVFRPYIEMDASFCGYMADSPSSALQKARMGRGFKAL